MSQTLSMGKGSTRGPRDPWKPHSDPRRVHREQYTIFPLLNHRLLAVLPRVLDPIVVGPFPLDATCSRHIELDPTHLQERYANKCFTLSELTD